MKKRKRATKIEVLQFIWKEGIVRYQDLMEKFGYTEGGASSMLSWLKREKLVVNDVKGEWVVTDRGVKRLLYYGMLE